MWQCDIILGLTWQYVKQSLRMGRMEAHDGLVPGACERQTAHGGAWWRVERMLVRQKLQPMHGGVCKGSFWQLFVGFCSGS